jgi:hypothetical protein
METQPDIMGLPFKRSEVNRKSNIIIKVVKGLFNMLVQFQLLHEACFIGQYQHNERIGLIRLRSYLGNT